MKLTPPTCLFLLVAAFSSCSTIDNDAMEASLHHTLASDNASRQASGVRQQYFDYYDYKDPYEYYLSKGFSEEKARRLAKEDAFFSDPASFNWMTKP